MENDFNSINFAPRYVDMPVIPDQNNADYTLVPLMDTPPDQLSLSNRPVNKQKKVSVQEGAGLLLNGFADKVVNTAKSIVQHPAQTLAMVGLTTAGLFALPFIGISTGAGAAALALGYGAYAAAKTLSHSYSAIMHDSNGQYDSVRNDLRNIGGDGVDLALSLPFVPKAIEAVKATFKYGGPVGFNQELWTGLKKADGIKAKFNVFKDANAKLMEHASFEQLAAKLKIKPELKTEFAKLKDLKGKEFAQSAYKLLVRNNGHEGLAPELEIVPAKDMDANGGWKPVEFRLRINEDSLKRPKSDILNTLSHELEHMNQDFTIIRAKGLRGFAESLAKYTLKEGKDFLKGANIEDITDVAMERLGKNKAYYDRMLQQKGIIKAGTPEYAEAERIEKAMATYHDFKEAPSDKTKFKDVIDQFKSGIGYKNDYLEKEARAAGKKVGKPYATYNTLNNMAKNPAYPVISNVQGLSAIAQDDNA